jgi:hypothetical protein
MICLLHLNMPGVYSIMCSSLWQLGVDPLFKCLWQETRTLFIAPSIREFSQNNNENCIKSKQFRAETTSPTCPLHMIWLLLLSSLLYCLQAGYVTVICLKQTLFLRYDNNKNNYNYNYNYYFLFQPTNAQIYITTLYVGGLKGSRPRP